MQVVVGNQVFNTIHRKRHPHRDADRPDRQQLDDTLQLDCPVRSDPFHRREPNHLWLVEKVVTRMSPAGVELEGDRLLPEQLINRLARQFISHVVGINIDHLPGVSTGLGRFTSRVGFGFLDGRFHTTLQNYADAGKLSMTDRKKTSESPVGGWAVPAEAARKTPPTHCRSRAAGSSKTACFCPVAPFPWPMPFPPGSR